MSPAVKSWAGFSSAAAALFIALITACIVLAQRVTTLEAAAITPAVVEHIVDLKTTDKLEAIQASLNRIESNINRLQDNHRSR